MALVRDLSGNNRFVDEHIAEPGGSGGGGGGSSLGAVATVASPTYVEGDEVATSVDLNGNTRVRWPTDDLQYIIDMSNAIVAMSEEDAPLRTPIAKQVITMSPDTSALAGGDVAVDITLITDFFDREDGHGRLEYLEIWDQADQGVAIDIVFLSANTALGTENSPPNITDANGLNIRAVVQVGVGDFVDFGDFRKAEISCQKYLHASPGTRNLYVGAIARGTVTYTSDSLKICPWTVEG